MRILHTADWHIGQLFHDHDRSYEHQQFLNWLLGTLQAEQISVLLISGDVFDQSNPSAGSVKMFYSFLNQAVKANPDLQIIITAGNHDSASRLESPKPLLESSNIHIIGLIEKDEAKEVDYSKITIPLKNKTGEIIAWCMAVPFLRMGDYPAIPDSSNPYTEGVTTFYQNAYNYAASQKQTGQAIIALGHLHAQQAEISDTDRMERVIMGGLESISASAFHEDISYVALGHIHKAQRLGGKEHIRYCGSPLPMSFSEDRYKHQVILFELNGGSIQNLSSIEVPVSVPLLRIPTAHSSLPDVLNALLQLNETEGDSNTFPFLEVKVLLDGPEPGLRHKIETALTGKNVRLAKIDVRYPQSTAEETGNKTPDLAQLTDQQPVDVLRKVYQNKYNTAIPDELLKLFQQVTQEVSEIEAQ